METSFLSIALGDIISQYDRLDEMKAAITAGARLGVDTTASVVAYTIMASHMNCSPESIQANVEYAIANGMAQRQR